MAKLKIKLHGKQVTELLLNETREYTAGRAENCEIILQNENSISRQHFKILFKEGKWTVESLSKFGALLYEGQPVKNISFESAGVFAVPPYEFEFSSQAEGESQDIAGSHLPVVQGERSLVGEPDSEMFQQRTAVGSFSGIPFIKIVDADNETKQLVKLEGLSWIAGRDPNCAIHIDDQRVSRRQFEISQTSSEFYIIDLGSVNGTFVNGNPISSNNPTLLKSGDAITVLDNHIYFELRDPDYERKMELVKSMMQMSPAMSGIGSTPQVSNYYENRMPEHPITSVAAPQTWQDKLIHFDYKKNGIRIAAGLLLVVGLVYYVLDDGGKPKAKVQAGIPQDPFSKLTPQQQTLVKHSYNLGKNLYMQGKYELAASEIAKVHELVPEYQDSRVIEENCKNAFEINRDRQIIERQEADKAATEQKIQQILAECRQKMNPKISVEEIETCVQPVLELSPENPEVEAMKAQAEQYAQNRKLKAMAREEYTSRVRQMQGLFERAENLNRNGEQLRALSAFQALLNANLPDPTGVKGSARRKIASIQQSISQQVASLLAEAKRANDTQDYKSAYVAYEKALKIDPKNQQVKEQMDKSRADLTKIVRNSYQESIIEESMGNVESAKEKWHKIMNQDIEGGDYYKKAQIKLKKYGGP